MVDIDDNLLTASTDSDSSRLRSRWSNDLLAQTFSAGSVDVCQVIRSAKPPPVPLRMELRCDGFETVRTKRKTITKCIDKLDKAKQLIISQMKEKAVSYDAYRETHDEIKAERNEQTTFNQLNSMGLFSKSSSSSLIQESFSAGSVDVCQVIRSNKPPPVPLRMELRCDGFETVRTKKRAINRCIEKLEKAEMKLLEAEKHCAVTYSDYVKVHDEVRETRRGKRCEKRLDTVYKAKKLLAARRERDKIKAERNEQTTFNQLNSMGLMSKPSSSSLIQESFSAGSVDICQVIRSNKPPPVPLRMEVRCDGFETVRTKRGSSNRFIEKLEKAEMKLLGAEKHSALTYSDYVNIRDEVRGECLTDCSELQNDHFHCKKSKSTLGTVSGDNAVTPDDDYEVEQNAVEKSYEESTENTHPYSYGWISEASKLYCSDDSTNQESDSDSVVSSHSIGSNVSYESTGSNDPYQTVSPNSSFRSSREYDQQLFSSRDTHSVHDNTISQQNINAVAGKSGNNQLMDITIKKNMNSSSASNKEDKYSDTSEHPLRRGKRDRYFEILSNSGEKQSRKGSKKSSEDLLKINNRYSITSRIDSMIINDQMLSFSDSESELNSKTLSTIQKSSVHEMVDPVINIFSSEFNQGKNSANLFRFMKTMDSPDLSDCISFDSDVDNGHTDRYRIAESRNDDDDDRYKIAGCRQSATDDHFLLEENNYNNYEHQDQENNCPIDEDQENSFHVLDDHKEDVENNSFDESTAEYIPLSAYNFKEDNCVHYVDAESKRYHYGNTEQSHYIDNKYRFSNLEQDENDYSYFMMRAPCVVNPISFVTCEDYEFREFMEVDTYDLKKKIKNYKKGKKKRRTKAFEIKEIVIGAD